MEKVVTFLLNNVSRFKSVINKTLRALIDPALAECIFFLIISLFLQVDFAFHETRPREFHLLHLTL